ncbi:hypothetical protein JQS43_07235 [Natronosporangium hydrolyticum]|uniref:Uncharacterized protein n=1 Tax=Natronosporangium hydrolyticum TaxID=2811111 RepID=A0A895YPQ4_9ACTN|nr:hypothetical protein [Natronosporangium hydrolyticum]QSB16090.1 hypothetical protein JQS43_07235 [Natronosporangium hydrolyticum]
MTGAPTAVAGRPLYARLLRLRHMRISGLASIALFEGVIAAAVLLALAEVTSWWAVPVLPLVVAAMVKLNDVLSGLLPEAGRAEPGGAEADRVTADGAKSSGAKHRRPATEPPTSPAHLPLRPAARAVRQVNRGVIGSMAPVESMAPVAPVAPVDSPEQRFRQSARRRYR